MGSLVFFIVVSIDMSPRWGSLSNLSYPQCDNTFS